MEDDIIHEFENEKEWRRHLTKEIAGIRKDQIKFQLETKSDIASLKSRSGLWGVLGGIIASVGLLLMYYTKQLFK